MDLATSLGVAGIAAVIGGGAARARKALQAHRLNKRYRLTGRYWTLYDDTEAGVVSGHYGISELRQRGTRITGSTLEDGERSWSLVGTLEPGGFIHGIYGAADPHDRGQGTFFLDVKGTAGDLIGMWAGFDSHDNGLDQGRYVFRRVMAESIRRATSDDADAVCALLGSALGDAYVTLDDVIALAHDPDTICLVARDARGRLIGALTAALIPGSELSTHAPAGQERAVNGLPGVRHVRNTVLVKNVAVIPKARGRGTASSLIEHAMEWATTKGARAAVAFGWHSAEGGCHIAGAMSATGFAEIRRIPDFWTADSEQHEYDCPACGHPCRCSAWIFARRLEPGTTSGG
ncbi:GNAT family N-acetyltransferase [Patulibacter minatonensis]|uniref:GNAT family N-acetyltransferase n=1 Tax=Patulibacter minatonensis TaxID=298163 RepID=UPI00047D8C0C|nr:GNAT family N-acetyltransferase [Patulibacter minatonensis]